MGRLIILVSAWLLSGSIWLHAQEEGITLTISPPPSSIARTQQCLTDLKVANQALASPSATKWREIVEREVFRSRRSQFNKAVSLKAKASSPLHLVDRWDAKQDHWISYDLFGNPWIIEEPTPATNIWKSLNTQEQIELVVYLAQTLSQEDSSKSIQVPLFKDLKNKISKVSRLRDYYLSESPEDRSAFQPHFFFYQARHHAQIRGQIVKDADHPITQWDPLPYALAAMLYKLGAPPHAIIIRSGSAYQYQETPQSPIKFSPEKFWLEIEIEDFLPPLYVSPSLIEEMSIKDQNSTYERDGTFGWQLKHQGQLPAHAKNQIRLQSNFLKRPTHP